MSRATKMSNNGKTPSLEDRKRSSPHSPTTPEDSRNPEKKINLNKSSSGEAENTSSIIVDPSKFSELELKLNNSDMLAIANNVKDALKDDIKQLIQESITEATKSVISSVSQLYEARVRDLEVENRTLKSDLLEFTVRVQELEYQRDEAEQYSRRNNVRISGFPVAPGESTDEIVIQMAKEMGTDIDIQAIDRSHRVGIKSNPKRDILVKFTSYRFRRQFLKNKKKLRECKQPFNNVYLNEDLTKTRARIMKEARVKVKSRRLKSAWTYDGKMLVKDNNDKIHVISSSEQLEHLY